MDMLLATIFGGIGGALISLAYEMYIRDYLLLSKSKSKFLKETEYNIAHLNGLLVTIKALQDSIGQGTSNTFYEWFPLSKGMFASWNFILTNGLALELLDHSEIQIIIETQSRLSESAEQTINSKIDEIRKGKVNTNEAYTLATVYEKLFTDSKVQLEKIREKLLKSIAQEEAK